MDLTIELVAPLVLLVFGVAFIYSNLGLGGGVLFVPILLGFGVGGSKIVAPISLTLTVMTAASSTINHHRKGFVDFRIARRLVLGTLFGAVLGTYLHIAFVSEALFKVVFIGILVVFGTMMLRDWVRHPHSVDVDDETKLNPKRLAGTTVTMIGSGFLSGLAGVGGGLLNVPLIRILLGRKTRKAIGTSSLLIMPTAAFGFALYLVGLSVSPTGLSVPSAFILIPILMPSVFAGAFIGSRLGLAKLKTQSIALIFILVLFVAAVQLALEILGVL